MMQKSVDASQQPLLQICGLSKRFGGLAALEGVDLSVCRGEIVGVIGPNGAGKTTLVNCIAGLARATEGSVAFRGQEITRLGGYRIGRLGIARTFQVVKPFAQLTVCDNVAVGAMFGARGRQRSAAEARHYAEHILERIGLQDRIHWPASDLTIVDLKRLELGKALAMDPELLFLDEVMAGLNLVEIERAMELIREINRSGVTIVLIEHVMKAIMGVSQRLVVLHYGRKIADGRPEHVASNPEVVEAYLGERFARRQRDRAQPGTRTHPEPLLEPAAGSSAVDFFVSGDTRDTKRTQPLEPSGGAAAPLLQVSGLKAGYGDVQVLWDVHLQVMPGEIVALVGANGAGKTTLLRAISKLIEPQSGRILVCGQDRTAAPADALVAAGVVHVPQGRGLFAGLTVRENLLQGAYLRRQRRPVQQDLQWVIGLLPRLGERLRQPAGQLSGGEQQMCAIGRALMSRPKLLMIDELSLGLAPKAVSSLVEVIAGINRQGTAVLLVEQDVQVALEHAHRGYVLENGRTVREGPASLLLDDPLIRTAYLGL
ncbi:MAG: ATP-binding cassette domain-containing protein [Acidobacteria bacterium]|nr:ATP-binding cassette domain-containing protein [Acidobacteriota bacterium]